MKEKIANFLFENKTARQTILKNIFWLFGGNITGRIIRVFLTIYATRLLGPESWGVFSYALGLATFFTIFADIGINALITRETSRQPHLKEKYLATGLFLKAILIVVLTFITIVLARFFAVTPEIAAMIPIIILIFSSDSLRDLGLAIARAMEKMEIEAFNNVLTNTLIVVFGFIALFINPTSFSLLLSYAVGTMVGMLVAFIQISRHITGIIKYFSKDLIRPIITSAWPFGLLGLMGVAMINTDTIMLGWMTTMTAVGFYSAAQKPILLLYLIPNLVAAAFFPMMSRIAHLEKEKARRSIEKSLVAVFLIAAPLTFGSIILGDQITLLFYGATYAPSILSFQILALTFLLMFPSTIIGNAIFTHDKQNLFFRYAAIGVLGNIILNLLLIPRWGIEGSAVATVITQIIYTTYGWVKMKEIINFSVFSQLKNILIASLITIVIIITLKLLGVNLIINLLVAGIAYLGILFWLKEPVVQDIKTIIKKI